MGKVMKNYSSTSIFYGYICLARLIPASRSRICIAFPDSGNADETEQFFLVAVSISIYFNLYKAKMVVSQFLVMACTRHR